MDAVIPDDSTLQLWLTGGLGLVGLMLVFWLVKVMIPSMQRQSESALERAYTENGRDREAFERTIERVCCAYEQRTEAVVEHLVRIDGKVESIQAVLTRVHGSRAGDSPQHVGV